MPKTNVAVVVGSKSNRKLAHALVKLARSSLVANSVQSARRQRSA